MKLFELYIRLVRHRVGQSWYWRTLELAETIEAARMKFETLVEPNDEIASWHLDAIREIHGVPLSIPDPLPPSTPSMRNSNYRDHGFLTFNERLMRADEYWANVGAEPPEAEKPRTRRLELQQ